MLRALTLALALLIGLHAYVAHALFIAPGWPSAVRVGGVLAVLAAAALIVADPIAQRRLPRRIARWIHLPAALWMGTGFLLLMGLLASELLRLVAAGVALAGDGELAGAAPVARARAVLVGAAAAAASLVGVIGARRGPAVRRVEVALARWPRALDGYRIVQISDVHIGASLGREFAADVVARCSALDPDLCAVTGDLVDGPVERLADEVAPFAALEARDGVFFVTGNHDHYAGADAWVEEVERLGWTALRNRHVELDGWTLAGVDDRRAGRARVSGGDVERALEGCREDAPVVLLAHDPGSFDEAAGRVALQLSGHTHGGQIWPFAWFVRLATPFVAGRHARHGSELHVSCGTGYWGPPMRLGTRAEITLLVLRAGA